MIYIRRDGGPNGGLSFGISAGVGIEGWLYAGGAINYGFKNNDWSFTLNAGAGGGMHMAVTILKPAG